jgi:O-acetylhomoserine (thiol)-lyase
MKRDRPERFGFETRMIHAGAQPEPITGARQTPIFQTTSYVFHDADHAASLFNLQTFGFIYSRLANPTVAVLEERIASLEGARGATCCATGHAAQVLAFFPLMRPGDSFVASNKLYGGSITQFGKTFPGKFGWNVQFVDVDDLDAVRRAVGKETKGLFVESLANPGGVVSDLEPLAEIANAAGCPLIVDNTLATPYLCRPIEWGADLIVHSTTKFLSGNGTSMGGCIVDSGLFDWEAAGKFPGLSEPEPAYHGLRFTETFGDLAFTTHAHAVSLRDLGPTMAPMNAFQTLLGIETLSLRMDRHCDNGLAVARFLEHDPRVAWVNYAGLESNKYHQLAKKYLGGRFGSIFTFGVAGGYEAGLKMVESCELFSHLANIGDARSLILHPASTTHRQLSDEQRVAAGAGPEVIRLSIGLETAADLIADLDQALGRAMGAVA